MIGGHSGLTMFWAATANVTFGVDVAEMGSVVA